MIVSASQLNTFLRCPRLWWWEKCRKMPGSRTSSPSQVMGKVLHSVVERYLKADKAGRHPRTKRAVNLYPDLWFVDDEGNVLPPDQRQIVKDLVDLAITEGILARRPGSVVEEHFVEKLAPGVFIQGFIDLFVEPEVTDHKTTSNMRYAKSKKQLLEDPQMLIYAKVKKAARIRHNVYCTTEPKVKKTETKVDPETVKTNWRKMTSLAKRMKKIRDTDYGDDEFLEIKGPLPRKCKAGDPPEKVKAEERAIQDACNAYGGCPFVYVCSGQETPTHYRRRKLSLANPDMPEDWGVKL